MTTQPSDEPSTRPPPAATVLVVDDSPENRHAVRRMLAGAGFAVREAARGAEALATLAAGPQPDLLVLDVNLPDMDGFELVGRVRADRDWAGIPVVHVSSCFRESDDRVRGLESGADAYLAAPFEPRELVAVVRALLRMREAEDSARRAAADWQVTFDSIRDGIAVIDSAGLVRRANASLAAMLGAAAADLIGRSCRDLGDAMLVRPFPEMPSEACKRTCCRESGEFRTTDGRWLRLTADPLPGRNGTFGGAVCTVSDVTETKRIEEQLREHARFTEAVNDAAPGLLYIFDLVEGRMLYCNRQSARVPGLPCEEVLTLGPRLLETLVDPSDRARGADHHRRIREGSGDRFEIEYRIRGGDGQARWLHSTETVFRRDPDGRPREILGFAVDVTERRRAEEERASLLEREQAARREAEAANRSKDEFLSVLSHELRTPLTAMLGWTQMLRMGALDSGDAAGALESLERNVHAQMRLVNDLLDVSRIVAGKLKIEARPIEAAEFVRAAADTLRPIAEAKGVRLSSVLSASAGRVRGDPHRLQQVVWNLLSNAVKFTPAGGSVHLELARPGDRLEITVADTGAGIPAEFLPHVFDRFRQADAGTTRRHEGLGLGLTIARHIVEAHGGTIRVESPGPGRGATFTVQLPAEATPTAPEPRPTGAGGNGLPSLAGLGVMVVDDKADTRRLLVRMLRLAGAATAEAGSAREAIAVLPAAIAGRPPDVLISDIGMPDEDGYALLRQVRRLPAGSGGAVPAVALTGYVGEEDRVRSHEAGFQQHLGKPVEFAVLVRTVAGLAGRN